MQQNYPGYEVGGARELVTLAMLQYLQDGTVLFGKNPATYGRCKDVFQNNWEGANICLGGVEASSPSVFGGLVVIPYSDWFPELRVGLLSCVVL
jgi:hypothetical protein